MKLITKDTDYALRALIFIAKNKNKIITAREISDNLNISYPFLRKLLQVFNKNKILISVKGKNGGFYLSKKPEEIFLNEIIEIFQGKIDVKQCLIGKNKCPDIKTCLIHKKLNKIEDFIENEFSTISVATLMDSD